MKSEEFDQEWENIFNLIMDWSSLGIEKFDEGGLAVANIKSVAPRFYLHKIYPGLLNKDVRDLEVTIGKKIPRIVREFYRFSNGCRLYDTLNVYGSIGKRNRAGQPISIRYGNLVERPKNLPEDALVVGSCQLLNNKEKSYLCAFPDDSIIATSNRDEFLPIQEWSNIFEMINSEMSQLSKLYNSSGERYEA